ncbi:MAG: hypothetical protein OXU23_06915 [Candidatus Poribacteria bacterium]|nr:hypothetical protein [Candidatus Poribacteria bacterium]
MDNIKLKEQAIKIIKQLPTEKLGDAIDYLSYLQNKEILNASHELDTDLEGRKSSRTGPKLKDKKAKIVKIRFLLYLER